MNTFRQIPPRSFNYTLRDQTGQTIKVSPDMYQRIIRMLRLPKDTHSFAVKRDEAILIGGKQSHCGCKIWCYHFNYAVGNS